MCSSDLGNLILTETGHEIASKVYERHLFLTELFKAMGVDPQTAEQDACEVEHAISASTFNLLKEHISHIVGNLSEEANILKLTPEDLGNIEDKINAPPAADSHN